MSCSWLRTNELFLAAYEWVVPGCLRMTDVWCIWSTHTTRIATRFRGLWMIVGRCNSPQFRRKHSGGIYFVFLFACFESRPSHCSTLQAEVYTPPIVECGRPIRGEPQAVVDDTLVHKPTHPLSAKARADGKSKVACRNCGVTTNVEVSMEVRVTWKPGDGGRVKSSVAWTKIGTTNP